MNAYFFDEKVREIRSLQQWNLQNIPDGAISRFADTLKKLKGWETQRINPIHFAEKYKFDAEEAISLFIYGAKVGLLHFEWSLLCPLCGGREHSYHSLNQLEKDKYHCSLCDVDVEVQADSHLEVSFTLPKNISGFMMNPYSSLENYWSYFFSPYMKWPPELDKAFNEQPPIRFVSILPGRKASIKIKITPVKRFRFACLDTHSIFNAFLEGNPGVRSPKIEVKHTDEGFDKKQEIIPGNDGEVVITNTSDRIMGCIYTSPDSNYLQTVIEKHPPYFEPFLTGKMMLNNQIFRDLFLVDNLPDDLSLKINDITLLFTDLKGSTELYDRTGDVFAYKLVQKHFKILQKVVHSNHGGIVKTMGDAIMASFNIPYDGIRAAFDMMDEIDVFNQSVQTGENSIGLKVGLHRGHVIAVKANQALDFFGQTVNIAARVQGLAGSGEVWITDEIMKEDAISSYFKSRGYKSIPKEVVLKGVGIPVTAHLCCR